MIPKEIQLRYDVTISICSYKRTHNLERILDALWNKQNFNGTLEIIVWNNNEQRELRVKQMCKKYLEDPRCDRRLELIQSTKNYYCLIRLAISQIMRSDCLVVCDDDVIPGENYINFFVNEHKLHSNDLLCVRGHKFLEHVFDPNNPAQVWNEYYNIKYVDESDCDQLVHFMHAHACLIPRDALIEVSSMKLPDQSFILVDDYWLSFVSSKYFGRKLRKLYINKDDLQSVLEYSSDADTEQLALYTRKEVKNARIKLYIHHMLHNWPDWTVKEKELENGASLPNTCQIQSIKSEFWNIPCFGVNISHYITDEDIEYLKSIGVSAIRIGSVDDRDDDIGFKDMFEDTQNTIKKLNHLIKKINLQTIITLPRKITSPSIWKCIAEEFVMNKLVVGYDLINEPSLELDDNIHWVDSFKNQIKPASLVKNYQEIIMAIREIDKITPIIVQPNYWGRYYALDRFAPFLGELKQYDENIIVSIHFFEPHLLTNRHFNKKKYEYPGKIPYYKYALYSETDLWNYERLNKIFETVTYFY